MAHATTAEELFKKLKAMPATERGRFFMLLGDGVFQDDNFTHKQLFGHLTNDAFTAQEAAEYLEVSLVTFRRYVQSGKIVPANVVGRNQMFATRDLKEFKRTMS